MPGQKRSGCSPKLTCPPADSRRFEFHVKVLERWNPCLELFSASAAAMSKLCSRTLARPLTKTRTLDAERLTEAITNALGQQTVTVVEPTLLASSPQIKRTVDGL